MVFWRFHSLRVQSSLAVTKTGSTGWKASARTPSKWLRRVYLAFHVFRNDSLFTDIYQRQCNSFLNVSISEDLKRIENLHHSWLLLRYWQSIEPVRPSPDGHRRLRRLKRTDQPDHPNVPLHLQLQCRLELVQSLEQGQQGAGEHRCCYRRWILFIIIIQIRPLWVQFIFVKASRRRG